MAVKKRAVTQEPLLSTVARKLGHAAGTITHMTHEFADNVSAMPETVAAKVRQAVKSGESKGRTRGRIRHARKKLSRTVRPRKTRTRTAAAKQRSPRQKALRRKARPSRLQK